MAKYRKDNWEETENGLRRQIGQFELSVHKNFHNKSWAGSIDYTPARIKDTYVETYNEKPIKRKVNMGTSVWLPGEESAVQWCMLTIEAILCFSD